MLILTRSTVLLLSGAALAWCQTQPEITIRTSTRLVELTAVVQDANGKPVTDLTKEDVTVTEDGKPQTISIFEVERGRKLGTTAAPLPAGFYSNRLEYRGSVQNNATVILIDFLNTPPGYWGRAQPHLARFLKQADPKLSLAIYTLSGGGVRILHDFTTDAALLTKDYGKFSNSTPRTISSEMATFMASIGNPAGARTAILGGGNGLDLAAALMAASEAQERAFYQPLTQMATVEALAIIAQRLSAVPGRKNLAWVSTGFKLMEGGNIRQVSAAFDRAVRALSNASVAVYPVDARGIMALTDYGQQREPNPAIRRPSRKAEKFEISITEEHNTMRELASRTGGRLFFGDEVDEALPRVFDDARAFYTIGYYPSNANGDGRFRKIAMRVRRKNVKVSHRAGYYALAEGASDESQRKAELVSAVWSPVDATAVGLDASLERDPAAPGSHRLALMIDGKSLLFEPRGDGLFCRMDLLVAQKDASGRQVESTLDTFEAPATKEKAELLRQQGLVHRKQLRLKPETAIVRVVVRNGAGALGSLSIPLRGL